MKLKFIIVLLSLFVLYSCSNMVNTNNRQTNEVNISLSNVSDLKFENATFNNVNFGNINPGEKTGYNVFKNQYSYGKVSITIDGEDYGWSPIDYVGENLLENGSYTFEYSFDNVEKNLTDKLIKE